MILILLPWLFSFAFTDNGFETWLPPFIGGSVLVYSLFPDYEYAALQFLPMPIHLALDALGGVILIASPWVFQFSESVWIPFVVLGIVEIGAAVLTQTVPSYEGGSEA